MSASAHWPSTREHTMGKRKAWICSSDLVVARRSWHPCITMRVRMVVTLDRTTFAVEMRGGMPCGASMLGPRDVEVGGTEAEYPHDCAGDV